MKILHLNIKGFNMMYKSLKTPIPVTVTDENFADNNVTETWIQDRTRHVIHMMGTLSYDSAGSNSYLLDIVGINIRLVFAKLNIILRTSDDEEYIYRVVYTCKLCVKRL